MNWTYKIIYFDEDSVDEEVFKGIVLAETYQEACQRITSYYGEKNISSITIDILCGSTILELQENTLETVKQDIKENYIW